MKLSRLAELSGVSTTTLKHWIRVGIMPAGRLRNVTTAVYGGTLVGKTDFTNFAQHTFVGAAQRNGHSLVVVQMYGSGDMYGQAIGLLDWGFSQYR